MLAFAMSDGLLLVDPSQTRSPLPPQVMIEEVAVDGEPVLLSGLGDHAEQIRVGPGIHSLDIAFTAVSFTAPRQTRFRHMLEGFDLDWVESEAARRAHYGPVPPGRYLFRVIAANAEGVWNEVGDTLALVVEPPMWRAWWFMTLSGLTGVGLIWAVIRYVTLRRLHVRLRLSEQQRAMERERTRIAQDMHDEIGSKLTRISFLSEAARYAVGEKGQGAPQVEAIADTSRDLLQALDEIVWAVNPRNDNLEHLVGYLEQYAREYFHGTPTECIITVPDQLPKLTLNAESRHNIFLAYEEALGNVLGHAHASTVKIRMALSESGFEIIVRDDGDGFSQPAVHANRNHRDGMRNMRERLRAVGGHFSITSAPGRGTSARLWFPFSGAGQVAQSNFASL